MQNKSGFLDILLIDIFICLIGTSFCYALAKQSSWLNTILPPLIGLVSSATTNLKVFFAIKITTKWLIKKSLSCDLFDRLVTLGQQ